MCIDIKAERLSGLLKVREILKRASQLAVVLQSIFATLLPVAISPHFFTLS